MQINSTPYQVNSTPYQAFGKPYPKTNKTDMHIGKQEQNPISFTGFFGGGQNEVPEAPKKEGLNYLA